MAHFTDPTTTRDLVERWPYQFQQITDEDLLYEYLGVYATEIARIDAFADTLYEQRFIESATGSELEKLAAGLGVTREENEDDETFRYRVKLRYAQAVSNGTAEDMAYLFTAAFGDDADRVEIAPVQTQPVLLCIAPEDVLTASPLRTERLESILADAMPCGTDLRLSSNVVFTFGEDGESLPPYAGGFGDGEWGQ